MLGGWLGRVLRSGGIVGISNLFLVFEKSVIVRS